MIQLKKGVYWVGAVDWDIKNFHGYVTHRGTTYNSYLLVADKIALVDTVKAHFFETMLRHIKEIVDPSEIDYIISNHGEPDHSGSLTKIAGMAPNAKIIASERGKNILTKYYGDLDITTIKEQPTLDLGGKTLTFVPIPMAHWPDSMVSYVAEDKLLLSNDAFGQHLASAARFNDEVDQDVLMHEAATYYANILMPLCRSVDRAIKALEGVEIDMIAPSHGVIWRKNLGIILEAYKKWVAGETTEKVVIAYDTMWESTKKLAYALAEGVGSEGVPVKVYNLTVSHRSDVIADILEAKAVLIGSPTLNNHVFPTVAGFLAYMRGLKPMNKIGAAFGSYGWAGGAKKFVEEQMKLAGIDVLESDIDVSYKPTEDEWQKAFNYGKMIAQKVKEG
ncbi:MAG: FprA family A-type flavoprotein [Candidatus Bathyarchaeota archaeon]|nr:FprA family A-type flavoprotein [Candidatus Bathyarchaeota archaeon]